MFDMSNRVFLGNNARRVPDFSGMGRGMPPAFRNIFCMSGLTHKMAQNARVVFCIFYLHIVTDFKLKMNMESSIM